MLIEVVTIYKSLSGHACQINKKSTQLAYKVYNWHSQGEKISNACHIKTKNKLNDRATFGNLEPLNV